MKTSKNLKGVLLYPGAGSDRNQSSLLEIERSLSPLPVRRADFGYRKAGRRAPDRAPVLLDEVRAEAADFATKLAAKPKTIVLGGRSMGGRMCSIAAAGEAPGEGAPPVAAAGLILICYPLHPPGKPDKLRVEHLPRLTMPCLFISGTRDAFGTPDEMTEWTATIPGAVIHVWLEGKGHDLKGCDAKISAAIAEWLETVV